jgi:hypothetical protein
MLLTEPWLRFGKRSCKSILSENFSGRDSVDCISSGMMNIGAGACAQLGEWKKKSHGKKQLGCFETLLR